jgi:hypothetical protein
MTRASHTLLVICLLLPAFLNGAQPELTVWLDPVVAKPGDIVKLQAHLESPTYATFSLTVPKHDSLYFVNQQVIPAQYHDGVYSQQSTWTLQTIEPGTLQIEGIEATIQQGSATRQQAVAPLTLTVESYPIAEDPATPLPLPTYELNTRSTFNRSVIWVIATGFVLLFVGVLASRRNKETTLKPNDTSAPLVDLESSLAAGQLPTALIESVLHHQDLTLSDELRNALEQTVYNKNHRATPEALLETLRKDLRA